MGEHTQKNRPIRIDTPLGKDVLLLEGFESEEGLSRPYLYSLELLSEDLDIDPADLLRKSATVTVATVEGGEPFVTHGLFRSFVRLGVGEGLARYRAEIVPALWFLTQKTDCRIFQNKSVDEIVAEILNDGSSAGPVKFDDKLSRGYPKREFCVQYRESDFNFVSRLLEEEGIYYWFEHTDSDHTMILADQHTTFKACPGHETIRVDPQPAPGMQVVQALREEHAVRSHEVMLMDYDPLQPSLRLYGDYRGTETLMDPVFDYPGLFTDLDAGEYLARVELERREKFRFRVSGTSNCRGLRTGSTVQLAEHFRASANRGYYLDRVRHSAHSGAYRSWDDEEFHYSNEFTAYPDDVPFRPDHAARRPVVRGTQTALVVGKSGEEVWVDEHGRVKIQFFWDRYGKKDENSSCWVRVATQTAGKNWGHIEIPRIGHEVLVDFLEGNPDRPIIVGSVYNAEMKTPYPLPDKGVQSGIKTRSSKGGGGYNELVMDDVKDKELIRMHAQKNLQEKVLNDESRWVGNHQLEIVKGSRGTLIEGKAKLKLEETEELGDVQDGGSWEKELGDLLKVLQHRYLEIGQTQKFKVEKGHYLHVVDGVIEYKIDKGDHTELVTKGNRTTTVTNGDIETTADMGSITTTAKMKHIVTEAKMGNITTEAKLGNITTKAAVGQITIEALQGITIKCGMAEISLKPAMIEMKVGPSKITLNPGQAEMTGVMAALKGMAMAQIQAGFVKIN